MLHGAAQKFQRVHDVVVAAILHRPMVQICRAPVKGHDLGVKTHSLLRSVALLSRSQLLLRKLIALVAEVAIHLRPVLLADHVFQFLAAQGDQRPLHALARTIAAVGRQAMGKYLRLEMQKELLHRALEMILAHGAGDVHEHAGACLDGLYGGLAGPGEHLDDQPARGLHALAHQHAQRHQRGHLLRGGEIHGEVLGDLAGDEVDHAHIRLAQAKVLDHGEAAILAHGRAHGQFAIGGARQFHIREGHIALDGGVRLAHGHDGADGTSALDGDGEALILALEHAPHHRGCHQRAPQRRRGRARQAVDLAGALHHLRTLDEDRPGLTAHQRYIVHAVHLQNVHLRSPRKKM